MTGDHTSCQKNSKSFLRFPLASALNWKAGLYNRSNGNHTLASERLLTWPRPTNRSNAVNWPLLDTSDTRDLYNHRSPNSWPGRPKLDQPEASAQSVAPAGCEATRASCASAVRLTKLTVQQANRPEWLSSTVSTCQKHAFSSKPYQRTESEIPTE
jgi:phospholipase C